MEDDNKQADKEGGAGEGDEDKDVADVIYAVEVMAVLGVAELVIGIEKPLCETTMAAALHLAQMH